MEALFKMLLRCLTGGVAMVTLNLLLDSQGIPTYVGVNGITLLTCGVLGVPGFLALYGLSLYQLV